MNSQNRILAALPADELGRLLPHLEPAAMRPGETVSESRSGLSHLYFVTGGIVSLLQVLEDGTTGEIAVVGNEGAVAVALFLGDGTSPSRAVAQSAVSACRLRAEVVHREFGRGGALQRLLLRFTQALIAQTSQTAMCNRQHSIQQQLCRRLLMMADRLGSDEIRATQESIAGMLGVRREGISEAARELQAANIIRYARGRIRVLDRPGLQKRSCECYRVVTAEYARFTARAVC